MSELNHPQQLRHDCRLRLAARVRVQTDRVRGKPVLLYPEGVLFLNPTGAAIVALCDGRHTPAEMVATLAERYDAPPDLLARDVTEYLNRLRDRGLVESAAPEDEE